MTNLLSNYKYIVIDKIKFRKINSKIFNTLIPFKKQTSILFNNEPKLFPKWYIKQLYINKYLLKITSNIIYPYDNLDFSVKKEYCTSDLSKDEAISNLNTKLIIPINFLANNTIS